MTKFVITLEVEMDTTQTVEGCRINTPDRWDYNSLLSAGGFTVSAYATQAYEACCESYVEWASEDADDRYPSSFAPYFHDEDCTHFVAIEEADDDEDEEITPSLLDNLFGDVHAQLDRITIRPTN